MKRFFALALLMLVLVADACKNPIEGVELRFIEPLPVAVELQFYPKAGELPGKIEIQLAGPDADKILTTIRSRRFRVTPDGLLYLSLDPATKPATGKPIRFTVVAKAEGYQDIIYPVQLTNTNPRSLALPLSRSNAQAPIVEKSGQSSSAGVLQTTLIAQTPPQSKTAVGQTTLTVPQGTQLKDIANGPVNGALTVEVAQIDVSTKATAQAVLPGNGSIANPLTTEGKPGATQQFYNIAGAASIDIYNSDYQLVKTFSQPVRLAFAISPQTYHLQKKRLIQPGDQIPLFSYDRMTDQWRQEPAGQVQRSAQGGLEYVADITHLSVWVAGFTRQACASGPVFSLSTPFATYGAQYRCEVIEEGTGTVLQRFTTTIENGKQIRLGNLQTDTYIRFRLYDEYSSAVATSSVLDACATSVNTLDLKSFKAPEPPVYNPNPPGGTPPVTNPPPSTNPPGNPDPGPKPVTISLQFPCQRINESKLPAKTLYARYRETGTVIWKSLPPVRYESGKTVFSAQVNDMQVGKTYDLQAGSAPGYYSFSHEPYKLTSTSWVIRIKTQEYCY